MWEDKIKIYLQEVVWVTHWVCLAEDKNRWQAVVNVVMNLRVS
jgi:hypothetical protein